MCSYIDGFKLYLLRTQMLCTNANVSLNKITKLQYQ